MKDFPTLDSWIVVSPRFTRSISLVRDAGHLTALAGYILTPTGREVLRRLADALRGASPTRAWSLTGPYGSGKSAFALLVAQLLAGEESVRSQARKFFRSWDEELYERLFGAAGPLSKKAGRLCPVLVTGSRQPLEKSLVASLALSLRLVCHRGRPPQIVERLELLAAQAAPSGNAVVELFEEANEFLERFGSQVLGILLIVDELGKFLEYGASNPEQGDVFVLQQLAEAATRSQRPFLFLTILHQSLDRYADHMSPSRRAEWAKVQGRFEDVAFEERTEQVLRLLTHAIGHKGSDSDLKAIRSQAKALAQKAIELGACSGSMNKAELQECLTSCYPLHPLTALILGSLFKQLAQNERSLFAFLASSEPFGFQEFLRGQPLKNSAAYRLDHLYDYVLSSLGPTLFAQHRGKLWAEVQSALDRLHDASDLEVRLAKTIGLLQALGPASGVVASRETLQAALTGTATETEIENALELLSRRSLVVFRRHANSYALWEGSDVDIDQRLQAARQSVEQDQNLAAFLTRQVPPRPFVARRHYFQTGTLRYFKTCYVDRSDFQADLFQSSLSRVRDDADGQIVFCLPRDVDDRLAMQKVIQTVSAVPVVAALPHDIFDLRELCHELACLRWVMEHTPELETDRTARRELRARLVLAEANLRSHLEWVFSPANSRCSWYDRGKLVALGSQRELNELLSRSCDKVYSATPHWRNELINRRTLSSSAAAARRNLIEAMFEHAEEEGLGFKGNPPERSMYETLLKASRLHRKQGGTFSFHAPDAKAEPALKELWKGINAFLAETETAKLSVERLFAVLRRPPFGLKDGVLPVLLAATLAHYHSQVALYEEGTFVPRPNAAVFERIFRSAEKFDLQRFRISGPRADVFQQYAALLAKAGAVQADRADLLTIVRPLVRLVKDLPDYVGKTKSLSQTAQSVLRTLREARQPDRLLFIELPGACNFPAFEAKGKLDQDQVEAYFETLRASLAELQRTYPQLLADVEQLIVSAFGHAGPLAVLRQQLEHEVRLVLNVAVDMKLKSFLLRVIDAGIEDQTWLESIATLLAGKPPTVWDDQDKARFEVQLAAVVRTFEHFKVLAYEMERTGFALLDGDHRMLRVSITVPNKPDLERVVQVPPHLTDQAERAKKELLQVLKEQHLLDKTEVSVALLAQIARQLLTEVTEAGN